MEIATNFTELNISLEASFTKLPNELSTFLYLKIRRK